VCGKPQALELEPGRAVRARTWDNAGVTRPARIASYAGAVIALWLLALIIAGLALEGPTRRGVAERIGESLKAEATIDRGGLALVRGAIELDGLAVHRHDLIGELAISVADLHCDLPPLGLALVDRDCRELVVHGARMEVSTAALFRLAHPRRPPLHAAHVVIDDARLELAASAILPSLGRVVIDIAHADAGDTTFKTPLSWIFALRALRAHVALPAGIALELTYDRGELQVAGGIFGAAPVAVPFTVPVADLADDPGTEIAKLVELGKDTAARLLARTVEDWLRSRLPGP